MAAAAAVVVAAVVVVAEAVVPASAVASAVVAVDDVVVVGTEPVGTADCAFVVVAAAALTSFSGAFPYSFLDVGFS